MCCRDLVAPDAADRGAARPGVISDRAVRLAPAAEIGRVGAVIEVGDRRAAEA